MAFITTQQTATSKFHHSQKTKAPFNSSLSKSTLSVCETVSLYLLFLGRSSRYQIKKISAYRSRVESAFASKPFYSLAKHSQRERNFLNLGVV